MDSQMSARRDTLNAAMKSRRQVDEHRILHRRVRPIDDFIGYVMLFCGAVSILITVGIVIVLGTESLRFFTNAEFIGANRDIIQPIAVEDTTIKIQDRGMDIKPGDTIEITQEIMIVEEVLDGETLVVQRGANGTTAVEHEEGEHVEIAELATVGEFLTGTVWQPQVAQFGMLPLLSSTVRVSLIAMLTALPVGLGAAIYLSEYASFKVRSWLKPILEILAGIPTVVYGYFALTFMTPLLRVIFGENTVQIYNVASAGIVMGIMITPTVASMSEDALSAVPRSLREASYGLGATKLETIFKILLPAALSGIIAAFIVGLSRAVGETMIVAVAAGAGPNFTFNPFEAAETITGHIARISSGDLSYNSIDYNSLFALGLTLFIITLSLNIIAGIITRRFREAYQ